MDHGRSVEELNEEDMTVLVFNNNDECMEISSSP